MKTNIRKYPVGIQTFSEIIRGEYVYIDKTDLVWQMAHYAKYVFLSRPRRFGKSLLSSTLESYFRGERELFEGLSIMKLESDWTQYPVIHLDLSTAKGIIDPDSLRARLQLLLKPFANIYGKDSDEVTPGSIFEGIIRRAYVQTGQQLVVIIDEYDAPLFDVLHDKQQVAALRNVMQEFYAPLKASDSMIKFCFITGITRFSQLSIFSTLNNMTNVSLNPLFSAICGITEEELHSEMGTDIQALADAYECSKEEMTSKLKHYYDGYHFSRNSSDIYNPYSLLRAFADQNIANYWFETGTPSFLIQMMRHFNYNITNIDHIQTTEYAINRPTEAMTSMIPLLYQAGYLTITGYDRDSNIYELAIPNQEVRIGYTDGLLPAYVGLEGEDVQTGFALKFWHALRKKDIELALREMQAFLASLPYVEGFKKKLADAATAEGFYEYTFFLIFNMLNVYVQTQVKCRGGRIDVVVSVADVTYVFELKTNGSAQQALEQIESKGYSIPYKTDGHRVIKVGLHFDIRKRTLDEWLIKEEK